MIVYFLIELHPHLSCSVPAIVLNRVGKPSEGYLGRIAVSERYVTLKEVTGADEGSYTISDAVGKIDTKLCLNVVGQRMTPSVSMSFAVKSRPAFSKSHNVNGFRREIRISSVRALCVQNCDLVFTVFSPLLSQSTLCLRMCNMANS